MHGGWSEEFVRQRNAGTLAEAEERRLSRLAAGAAERLSLRARAARWLFGFAVALEREEIWRVVWERLEKDRSPISERAILEEVEALPVMERVVVCTHRERPIRSRSVRELYDHVGWRRPGVKTK